jgi:hypothetical protein
MLASLNNADEHNPCAIIIINAPLIPHIELDNIPASIKPMWPTEEYAINDFRSGWRMQINLVTTAPVSEILISMDEFNMFILGKIDNIRANP